MTPLGRLALFFVALGAAFGGAVALGHAVGPLDRGDKPAAHGASAMEMAAPASLAAGLSIADHGLRLETSRTTFTPGRPQTFSFRITNGDGQPLRSYDVTHEKRMHLIVVRRDLTGFHHIHPVFRHGDRWVATLPALQPGSYRAFADFSTGGGKTVLGVDLAVPGSFTPNPLQRSHQPATPDGYIVSLNPGPFAAGQETTVSFHVTLGGRDVAVDRYLGARGHLVILRAGDLAYLHTHADEDSLQFGQTFPSAGRYRAFLQFSAGGSVHTAPFTVEVNR